MKKSHQINHSRRARRISKVEERFIRNWNAMIAKLECCNVCFAVYRRGMQCPHHK